jgi:hypothetical protein
MSECLRVWKSEIRNWKIEIRKSKIEELLPWGSRIWGCGMADLKIGHYTIPAY